MHGSMNMKSSMAEDASSSPMSSPLSKKKSKARNDDKANMTESKTVNAVRVPVGWPCALKYIFILAQM